MFQTYYAEVLLRECTLSTISWIGSVQLVIMYITGIVLGRAFDIYGARVCFTRLPLRTCAGSLTHSSNLVIACHGLAPLHILLDDDLPVACILPDYTRTGNRARYWDRAAVRFFQLSLQML